MDTILHVGDFWPSDDFCKTVDYWCERAGIARILVTLGNHEPWDHATPLLNGQPGMALRISSAVWVLPRPARFALFGREVLSLGGASSVDRSWRSEGVDWFPEELITEKMEQDAIAGGPADVLLTHESPEVEAVAEVKAVLARNRGDFPIDALKASVAQRERVDRVRAAVSPQVHLHGHMHLFDERVLDGGRRVISLNRDGAAGNVGILDLATLEFEPLTNEAIARR